MGTDSDLRQYIPSNEIPTNLLSIPQPNYSPAFLEGLTDVDPFAPTPFEAGPGTTVYDQPDGGKIITQVLPGNKIGITWVDSSGETI